MKLLLFDIDLTLIRTGGAGRKAMNKAFVDIFNVADGMDGVDFAGRTDRAIFKDALGKAQTRWTLDLERRFKKQYFELLTLELSAKNSRKCILPGIREILTTVMADSQFVVALLTGNWREGAKIKLEHFGLYDFFQFGAFADDSEFRNDLPAVAVRRLKEITGHSVVPQRVFVIGDTPLDVACAQSFGAKSIAVATGFFPLKELRDSQPDYLFMNFQDTERILQVLQNDD